ncbi:hypothetical protein [Mucilaginibacter sp. KACC 22063]|uniref:hypothetical protein n=1 Tax=Mucilaginibacter sp. KACC 22063 TaxID=3025666 RepID=UPI0023653F84|nr:hypothetical protein [Mucilaginibacter sp. KACC 22063]WDF57359.1 hypothetical protein PQ461_09860 [Mucilaginibacter sp. KACC 22063]
MTIVLVYFFVALTHIAYLPNLHKVLFSTSVGSEFIHKNHSTTNGNSIHHGGLRSTFENKRKVIVPKLEACVLFLSLVFSCLYLLKPVATSTRRLRPVYIITPHAYLTLRTLRI